jgi:hypothetical protein
MLTILLTVALLVPVLPLHAQAPGPACSYTTCAIRVEPSLFGTRIVRGVEAQPVAQVGIFGARPRLSELVAISEPAVQQARIFERQGPRGTLLLLSGMMLAVIPAFSGESWSDELRLGSGLAGVGLTLWGSFTMAEAQRALSRSIWWYNSELDR